MKLIMFGASPFARRVRVAAIELGLGDRIALAPVTTSPLNPDPAVTEENPLGRVPTLIRDEGPPLYESGIICEYIDSLASGQTLFPTAGETRWRSLRLYGLADGITQEGVTLRRESLRPAELRWPAWTQAFEAKIARTLDRLEAEPDLYDGPVEIGQIALACGLGWLRFRELGPPLFEGRPRLEAWHRDFEARPSMQATQPA
jgi:glutathione S-transferase